MLDLERRRLKYFLNVKIILWQFLKNVSLSKQLGEVREIKDLVNFQ